MFDPSRRTRLAAGAALAAAIFAAGPMQSANAAEKWDMFVFPGATHPISLRLKEFSDEVR